MEVSELHPPPLPYLWPLSCAEVTQQLKLRGHVTRESTISPTRKNVNKQKKKTTFVLNEAPSVAADMSSESILTPGVFMDWWRWAPVLTVNSPPVTKEEGGCVHANTAASLQFTHKILRYRTKRLMLLFSSWNAECARNLLTHSDVWVRARKNEEVAAQRGGRVVALLHHLPVSTLSLQYVLMSPRVVCVLYSSCCDRRVHVIQCPVAVASLFCS